MADVTAENDTEVAQTGRFRVIFNPKAAEYVQSVARLPGHVLKAPASFTTPTDVLYEIFDAAIDGGRDDWKPQKAGFSVLEPHVNLRDTLSCELAFNPAALQILEKRAASRRLSVADLIKNSVQVTQDSSATNAGGWPEGCRVNMVEPIAAPGN